MMQSEFLKYTGREKLVLKIQDDRRPMRFGDPVYIIMRYRNFLFFFSSEV